MYLETDGLALSEDETLQVDVFQKRDWTVAQIPSSGVDGDGNEVDVILHIIAGRLEELEVWTGDSRNPRTDIPSADTLEVWSFED